MANLNTTALSDQIKTFYERRLLTRALPRLVHGRGSSMARLNKNGAYEVRKYGELPVISSALTEGATPAESAAPSLTATTITPAWYGSWLSFTDEVELTSFDPILSISAAVLGEQCGLSADTLIRNALTDGATVDYAGDATSRATVDYPQHEVSYADFLKQVAELEAANAMPFEGEDFLVFIHPFTWASLMQDETFVNLFERESPSPIRSGFVGRIFRCSIYVTSNAREYADAGVGSTTDVYSMLFVGKESYATVGIGGYTPDLVDNAPETARNMTGQQVRPVEIIVKPLGSSGAVDPLNQRGSVGWKMSHGISVLNSAWIRNVEHANVASDD